MSELAIWQQLSQGRHRSAFAGEKTHPEVAYASRMRFSEKSRCVSGSMNLRSIA